MPGSLSDEGDIDEELEMRGIRILFRVSEESAERKLSEIEKKFSTAGFEVVREVLSND
jgi:hypothetical protein